MTKEYFDNPALNQSVAKVILQKSPLHAKSVYDNRNDDATDAMNIGSIVHDLVLRGINCAEVLDFENFRTKEARLAKETSIAKGKIPIIKSKFDEIIKMVDALKNHFDKDYPFSNGQAELPVYFKIGDTECKAKFDYVLNDKNIIIDYKTTTDANPSVFGRKIFQMGYDFQAAWYSLALEQLRNTEKTQFIFIVQEIDFPFAVSVIELDSHSMSIAKRKCFMAVDKWENALKNGFNGYEYAKVTIPPYIEAEFLTMEENYDI